MVWAPLRVTFDMKYQFSSGAPNANALSQYSPLISQNLAYLMQTKKLLNFISKCTFSFFTSTKLFDDMRERP